jgi:hemolysin-activating ACP:hemolysin acyltransferase
MYPEQQEQATAPNGSASEASAPSKQEGSPGAGRQSAFAQRFASVVAVLMRDANFRETRLADLEWLVIPAIMSGQCRLAHLPPAGASSKSTGVMLPVAVALWASVSDEIDARLSTRLDKAVVVKPNEWTTGGNHWLLAVAGDKRAIPAFLGQLEAQDFKGKTVKVRARSAEGAVEVLTLAAYRERKAREGAATSAVN